MDHVLDDVARGLGVTLTNVWLWVLALYAAGWLWNTIRSGIRRAEVQRRAEEAHRKLLEEHRKLQEQRAQAPRPAPPPEPRPEPAWQPPPRPRPRPTPPPATPWQPPAPDAASADAKAQRKIVALEALARSTTSEGERQAATNAIAVLREKHPMPPPAMPRHVTAQAWDFGRKTVQRPNPPLTDAERAALAAALAGLAAATASAVYVSMAGHRRGRKKRSSYR